MANRSWLEAAGESTNQPARAGAAAAETDFERLFQESYSFVHRYVAARVRHSSDVEDLVGETFERALCSWPSFAHRSRASTWVLGIARHVIADYYRRPPVRQVSLSLVRVGLVESSGPSPEEGIFLDGELAQLRGALDELSAADQELLALRYGAELSFKEIAQVTGLHATTVRVRVYRGRQHLKALLVERER